VGVESQVRRARLVVQEELGVERVREREAELEQVRSASVNIVRAD
jgi:hypothetical protein